MEPEYPEYDYVRARRAFQAIRGYTHTHTCHMPEVLPDLARENPYAPCRT